MQIKKMIVIFLLLFTSANGFASNKTIKFDPSMSKQIYAWEFGKEDGMIFLLGPESDHSLVIHVDQTTSQGAETDMATLYCNSTKYKLRPGDTVTCYGNFNDVIGLHIDPADYKNGSKGTYSFQPLTNYPSHTIA